jgi:hypothetical protein
MGHRHLFRSRRRRECRIKLCARAEALITGSPGGGGNQGGAGWWPGPMPRTSFLTLWVFSQNRITSTDRDLN